MGSVCGLELKPYHSKRQKMAAKVLLEQALCPIAAFSEVAVPLLVPLRESVPGWAGALGATAGAAKTLP